ncbi:MAG: hypothetical protein V4638_10390 [Bacteroidota bacterium]
MKKYLFIPLILAILIACSKDKRAAKRIDGSWELISMKYYDDENFLHYPVAEGLFEATTNSENQINYTFHLEFDYADSLYIEDQFGTIKFKEKASVMELSVYTADTFYVQTQTVFALNKTDLKVDFIDIDGRKRVYTFLKKD